MKLFPTVSYDGFGELHFESVGAVREALRSPEGEAALADIPNFCDTRKTRARLRRGGLSSALRRRLAGSTGRSGTIPAMRAVSGMDLGYQLEVG
jgi:EthD domain